MSESILTLSRAQLMAVTALLLLPMHSMVMASDKTSGQPKDNAYAKKLWQYMTVNQLIGEGRQRSYPFVGQRPHGSIQEVLSTQATIDGHSGRLIVKHNYGAKAALTPKKVYASEQHLNYEALTIMFQREDGYDTANNNWFWAEYKADGDIINYQGVDLSGRSAMCLGCHTPLGGKDREILNGSVK
jgi:hypothetical protein